MNRRYDLPNLPPLDAAVCPMCDGSPPEPALVPSGSPAYPGADYEGEILSTPWCLCGGCGYVDPETAVSYLAWKRGEEPEVDPAAFEEPDPGPAAPEDWDQDFDDDDIPW